MKMLIENGRKFFHRRRKTSSTTCYIKEELDNLCLVANCQYGPVIDNRMTQLNPNVLQTMNGYETADKHRDKLLKSSTGIEYRNHIDGSVDGVTDCVKCYLEHSL
uniref:Uncharacterized protein n=1 Tax=Spongospora subterranea TaxID=70186 RepID=A0A0H5QWF6_9EUKA|eukprot:CRZ05966.1 hypothetical protein [Spongospora subterranea]